MGKGRRAQEPVRYPSTGIVPREKAQGFPGLGRGPPISTAANSAPFTSTKYTLFKEKNNVKKVIKDKNKKLKK